MTSSCLPPVGLSCHDVNCVLRSQQVKYLQASIGNNKVKVARVTMLSEKDRIWVPMVPTIPGRISHHINKLNCLSNENETGNRLGQDRNSNLIPSRFLV